jgi:hypothetical protein
MVCVAAAFAGGCGGAEGANAERGLQVAGSTGQDASARAPKPPDGTAWVVNGTDTIHVEVARTDAERGQGLMGRDSVPDGTGMIFVFPNEAPRGFWMRDTPTALDIAYINALLQIIDIQQMEPLSDEIHNSAGPAMFALEVRKGWFEENEWSVGDQLVVVFPER